MHTILMRSRCVHHQHSLLQLLSYHMEMLVSKQMALHIYI